MYISSVPGSPYSAKCAANPTEPRAATICVPVGACLGFWRTRMPTGSLPIIEPGHTLESTLNPACPSALTSCCPSSSISPPPTARPNVTGCSGLGTTPFSRPASAVSCSGDRRRPRAALLSALRSAMKNPVVAMAAIRPQTTATVLNSTAHDRASMTIILCSAPTVSIGLRFAAAMQYQDCCARFPVGFDHLKSALTHYLSFHG